MAVDAKDDFELSMSCTKKDWRKFLADIAYTCNVNINWASEINPTVSSLMLNYICHLSPLAFTQSKLFVAQDKFQDIKPDGLRRVFREFVNTAFGCVCLHCNYIYEIGKIFNCSKFMFQMRHLNTIKYIKLSMKKLKAAIGREQLWYHG